MISFLDRIPTEPSPPHYCSFIDLIAAIVSSVGAAFGGGAAAAGVDAAALGAAGAGIGAGVDAAALGAAGLGAAGLGAAGVDAAALGGAGALGAAGTGALDVASLAGPAALEGAATTAASAAPAAGAVTSPLAALDTGGVSALLDTGAGAGATSGAGTTALSFAPDLAATQEAISAGIFDPIGSNFTTFAASPEMTAAAGGVQPGLDVLGGANAALETGVSGSATSALDTLGAAGKTVADTGAGGTFSSIMGGLKTAAPLVPLAGLATTLAKGQPLLPPQAQQLSGLGSSLAATGQQNLQMAANQQITAPQMAEIATWKQQQMNALYQLYAKNGLDPNSSTDYLQGVQQINQQAISMEQQFIDQLIKTGLGETGQATSALTSAANMQIQQDQAFQTSLSNAIKSFGLVAGLSGMSVNLSKAA